MHSSITGSTSSFKNFSSKLYLYISNN